MVRSAFTSTKARSLEYGPSEKAGKARMDVLSLLMMVGNHIVQGIPLRVLSVA